MLVLDFYKRFPDEAACRQFLREKREEQGITCAKCGGKKHYWYEKIQKWQCADNSCRARTNLRSGTMMEQSKLPILYWFKAIHLMTSTKKALSALEMQRQLDHKYYKPVLAMMHKIRKAMGFRDNLYKLAGEIEIDEAFITVVDLVEYDEKGNKIKKRPAGSDSKRGRGSEKKQSVIVMVESSPMPNNGVNPKTGKKYTQNRKVGNVKMVATDLLSSDEINFLLRKHVEPTAKILSDGWQGYSKVRDEVKEHQRMVVPSKQAHKKLPWVHITISNVKRKLLGIHHSVSRDYFQNYLDELSYKMNRRHSERDMFDRVVTAVASQV
jgi:hypothetical protein